MAAKLPTEG